MDLSIHHYAFAAFRLPLEAPPRRKVVQRVRMKKEDSSCA